MNTPDEIDREFREYFKEGGPAPNVARRLIDRRPGITKAELWQANDVLLWKVNDLIDQRDREKRLRIQVGWFAVAMWALAVLAVLLWIKG